MKKLLIATMMNIMMFTTSTFAVTDTQGVQDFVSRFYTEVLDRAPDQAGLDDWTNRLITGESAGSDVATGFIFSQEFTNRNTDNTLFLNILYRAFFNREADSGGFTDWLDKLNQGTSREDVLNGFLFSQEFANLCDAYGIKAVPDGATLSTDIENFVKRFYLEVLGRTADAAGLADWTNRLSSGTATGADIAIGFVFSQEFTNRNTDDVTFLEILYKAFFNRDADEGGLSGWLYKLEQGVSRLDVLNGFLHSDEFVNLCIAYGIVPYDGFVIFNLQNDSTSSYKMNIEGIVKIDRLDSIILNFTGEMRSEYGGTYTLETGEILQKTELTMIIYAEGSSVTQTSSSASYKGHTVATLNNETGRYCAVQIDLADIIPRPTVVRTGSIIESPPLECNDGTITTDITSIESASGGDIIIKTISNNSLYGTIMRTSAVAEVRISLSLGRINFHSEIKDHGTDQTMIIDSTSITQY